MGKKDRFIRGSLWDSELRSFERIIPRNPVFTASSLGIRLVHDEPPAEKVTLGGEWDWENDFRDYPRVDDIYRRDAESARSTLGIRLAHNIKE